jgi:LmbE family N-acetylglucosaminyl deacetylase
MSLSPTATDAVRALVVITHPDDELFMSGTLALLSRAQIPVSLVCVTRGEAGSGPDCLAEMDIDLGRIREGELIQAVKILGIEEVHVLGFADIHPKLFVPEKDWDLSALCDCIQSIIAHMKPTLVFSHGPHGGTGHPAHKAVYHATSLALQQAASPAAHYSFAAMTEAKFYREFFDDDCEFYVDVRSVASVRELSFSYHQSQLQIGEFLNPPFPRSLRKVLSALFGYCFWFTEAGRARIPTLSLAQFFRRYPYEGFVTRRPDAQGGSRLEHILKDYCHRAPASDLGKPRVERERDLGARDTTL